MPESVSTPLATDSQILGPESTWIVGLGAVGGYIAAHLLRAGHRPHLIDTWPEHVDAINRSGILVDDVGDVFTVPARASEKARSGLPGSPPETVLLACKIRDLNATVEWLEDCIGFSGLYVATLNGLADFDLADRVGAERVIGCIVSGLHGQLVGPGHIKRHVPRRLGTAVFRLGHIEPGSSALVSRWEQLFDIVDTSETSADLLRERWTKLQYNAITAALSAVSDLPIRALCLSLAWRARMVALGVEVAAIARAEGVALGSICALQPEDWIAAGEGDVSAWNRLNSGLAAYGSKMSPSALSGVAYDLRRGRPTEAIHLNGTVVARAEALGLDAPENRRLLEELTMLGG
jgi:2-dehydropantoate 2-reductase